MSETARERREQARAELRKQFTAKTTGGMFDLLAISIDLSQRFDLAAEECLAMAKAEADKANVGYYDVK